MYDDKIIFGLDEGHPGLNWTVSKHAEYSISPTLLNKCSLLPASMSRQV